MKKPIYVYDLSKEDSDILTEQKLDPNDFVTVEVLALNLQGMPQVATYKDTVTNKDYPMLTGALTVGLPIEQQTISSKVLLPNQNPIGSALPMPPYVKVIVAKEHLHQQIKKDYEKQKVEPSDFIKDLALLFDPTDTEQQNSE